MRIKSAIAITILLAVSLTACGKSKKSASTSSTSTTAASTAAKTLDVSAGGGPNEYMFHSVPNSVQAGQVTINFHNVGVQDHQMQLLRLQDGKTLPDFVAAATADPTGLAALALVNKGGGINAISPGTTQTGVSDLTAGNWLMVCFVPAPDGKPHIAHGMLTPFVVTAPPTTASAPTPDVTASAKNFQFTLPTFKSGSQTVAFKNNSTDQVHELSIIKVAAGKTAADVHQFLYGGVPPTGPPPFSEVGGPPGTGPGDTAFTTVDLAPGTYIAVCHVPNSAAGADHGKEHALLGMFTQFTVS